MPLQLSPAEGWRIVVVVVAGTVVVVVVAGTVVVVVVAGTVVVVVVIGAAVVEVLVDVDDPAAAVSRRLQIFLLPTTTHLKVPVDVLRI
ncbi:MAG: hypothetical protein ACO31D_07675 [Ilumatobacteraceae bacterium]|jgi:putative effector of murein hydrolase LrgA (UPF0299 family)